MISSTLYAKYIEERTGGKILEDEFGFIEYRIAGTECFIVDSYVLPEKRKLGHMRALEGRLESIAIEAGCDHMTGNIHLGDSGASKTLVAAILIGFEVVAANAGVLLISKKLGGSNG